ncbi:MAG: aspartyl protease family protein [Planctomycetes bacterium]|nr:aspartyl protease family protein [Planctomycetota bacterium]
MGRTIVRIKLTNYRDLVAKDLGVLEGEPRQVEVEALVDTGATGICLKPSVIQVLGLLKVDTTVHRTANGKRRSDIYSPARLDLMGRYGNFDVVELAEDAPNLLGQIPLEHLDLVVDPATKTLQPNPEHDGEWAFEAYCSAAGPRPRRSATPPAFLPSP